jgi:pilus assembly protein Flp/PilA
MLKLFVALQTHVTGVLNRDRGATAVEYGLLVGLIALVIIVVVTTLGTKLAAIFTGVNNKLPTPAST